MTHDLAIPILPCRSVGATVAFYQQLGFEGGARDPDGNLIRIGQIIVKSTLEAGSR